MKVTVTLKDPDGFYDSVQESVINSLDEMQLDEEEKEALYEVRMEMAWKKLEKWVEYSEYVTIEFDLENGTATVLPKNS